MTTVAIINARLLDPATDYDGPGGLLIQDGRISRVIHGPTPDLAADQIIDAIGLNRHRADHRQPQFGRKRARIDPDAAFLSQIVHVQRQHTGQTKTLCREHQTQIATQVGGINDADHQIGPLFALRLAK